MSFILDALKKSEAERQRQSGPALLEMRVVRPQRRIPVWLITLGVLLIVVNLVGLVWLLLRPSTPAAPAAAATAAAASAVPVPAAAPGAGAQGAAPLLAPGERLIGPAAAGPGSLANEGANVPALMGSDDGPVAGDLNPADFLPAETQPRSARSGAALRNYGDVSNAVPALRLDLHVYDANPSRRYAFINMKKVREGDATADGARVLEITRDGVVMNYRSTEFLLTSDSSATRESAVPGADNR